MPSATRETPRGSMPRPRAHGGNGEPSTSIVHSVNFQASVSELYGDLQTRHVFGSLANPATVFLAISVASCSIGATLAG
jgi:hypothetical protein